MVALRCLRFFLFFSGSFFFSVCLGLTLGFSAGIVATNSFGSTLLVENLPDLSSGYENQLTPLGDLTVLAEPCPSSGSTVPRSWGHTDATDHFRLDGDNDSAPEGLFADGFDWATNNCRVTNLESEQGQIWVR